MMRAAATALSVAILGLTAALAVGCNQPPTEQPVETTITAEQLLKRLDGDHEMLILDVRTPGEFATGHVPGAVNISHTEIAGRLQEVRGAGDVDVVVYCRSGRRAGIAEKILRQAGFRRLLHLEGDMLGWLDKHLPVETSELPVETTELPVETDELPVETSAPQS